MNDVTALSRSWENATKVMRIISKRTLRQFWLHHPQAEEPLKA
jgi:hypothetical protein